MGEQSCREDGSGFNMCNCDGGNGGDGGSAGSAGNGSLAGSGGSGDDPMPVFGVGLIGAPCASDADCSDAVPNFTCIESTSDVEFEAGGPEGGYCTVPCRDSDDCEALDGASACGFIDPGTGEGFCIALCATGQSNAKCGAGEFRAQACVQSPTPGLGACFPMCTSDEGCGEGRFCGQDIMTNSGLCVDTAPVGGGVGAACTPETAAADCASGICLTFSDAGVVAGGFCSASCTFGSLFGCGYAPGSPATTVRENFCLQEQDQGGSPGDLGFCFELCDVDADCAQDDWVCDAFGGADLQEFVGRQGQCVPASLTNDGEGDAGPG